MFNASRLMQGVCTAAVGFAATLNAASAQQTIAPASNTPVPGPVPQVLADTRR
jgi:hypothetical protein